MKSFFYTPVFICLSVIGFSNTIFAQTEREKGIEFYKSGNYTEAVRLLSAASKQTIYKKDGEIWNYIGLAYINQKETKQGRKAFEKAVKMTPQSSSFHANLAYAHLLERKVKKAQSEIGKAIQIDPKNSNAYYIRGTANLWEGKNERAVADAEQTLALNPRLTAGYVLHSDALLASFGEKWADTMDKPQENFGLLTRATDSLNKCLKNCPKDDALPTVSERADTIKAFLDYFERKNASKIVPIADTNQNITPLSITFKPKPSYTDEARHANETGNIRVAVLFGADGKIRHLLVLKGLRYGLNEQAMKAARNMIFDPQKIDGNPVSVLKIVVFNFVIY